ncbi:Putative SOS response-associated peptidase YedK [Acaryochloris thomasi RCC1774]|uniref:Abasic site processing protein n=1 Tax=Acaryochloris thomasi RCC1774 TaxID=1764569 RepID=A0A2W1JN57_9CYAN|nr:SOS response-associated peptidase [Acaryochloris thomasi]PZD74770.1 Putative SOS response-associated peptidase YedK [Acaryochloris thomasi RCC1774]
MCGRFTLTQPDAIASTFNVTLDRIPPPRYNIAPTQPLGVIVNQSGQHFRLMSWGLIPSWTRDPNATHRMINARLETAHEKPSFRTAFRHRRCLIPADGFYEWKQIDNQKQPFYCQLQNQPLFAFAGLWDTWQEIETCTILTTAANADMQPIHHRMPVIINPDFYEQWLDPWAQQNQQIHDLLDAMPGQNLEVFPVSTQVNNAAFDGPECLQPL